MLLSVGVQNGKTWSASSCHENFMSPMDFWSSEKGYTHVLPHHSVAAKLIVTSGCSYIWWACCHCMDIVQLFVFKTLLYGNIMWQHSHVTHMWMATLIMIREMFWLTPTLYILLSFCKPITASNRPFPPALGKIHNFFVFHKFLPCCDQKIYSFKCETWAICHTIGYSLTPFQRNKRDCRRDLLN